MTWLKLQGCVIFNFWGSSQQLLWGSLAWDEKGPCCNENTMFVQIARELTISLSNRRFGLFPMKWQETLDPPKRPDEIDLIPNEVGNPFYIVECLL